MFPDGHFTFNGRSRNEYRGRIDWSDMVRRLLATRFFSGKTDYTTKKYPLDLRNIPTIAVLRVAYAGTSRSVQIDYVGNEIADIRDYERYVSDTVERAVFRIKQARAAKLGQFASIQSIELDRNGGYGPDYCCGRFHIDVQRSGVAHVWYCGDYFAGRNFAATKQGKCIRANGHVDFQRALAILAWSDYTSFEPRYMLWGFDLTGARLVVRYRNFTYTVDAPDSNHWPPGLTEVVYRFQQLIQDSSWSPVIPQ